MRRLKSLLGCYLALFLLCYRAGVAGELHLVQDGADQYVCRDGQQVRAVYYSVSDGSLSFVKVRLPDDSEHTLPRVLSASGVRYTDDFMVVWWTKGDRAFVQMRNEAGEWETRYADCRLCEREERGDE